MNITSEGERHVWSVLSVRMATVVCLTHTSVGSTTVTDRKFGPMLSALIAIEHLCRSGLVGLLRIIRDHPWYAHAIHRRSCDCF